MLSLTGISNETEPKSPANPYKAAVTFLGIRARRYSMMDKIQKEICRDIAKMFFCTLKPANKDIYDHEFLELISNVRPYTYVDLSGCRYLTVESVKGLAKRFPFLRRIKCFGDFSSIEALSKNCLHLKQIDLTALQYQGQLTDLSLKALESFQELTSLSLGLMRDYSFGGLTTLIENLPKLKKYKGVASFEVLMVMAQTCKGLTDLNVYQRDEYPIRDAGFKFLASQCPNIRSIKLDCLSKITDETLSALASNCTNLESVKLIGCDNISEKGIIDLTENCKRLKKLTLDDLHLGNTRITDQTLFALATHCHELVEIYMQDTQITEKGIAALIENCPHLRTCLVGSEFQSPLRTKYPHIKFDNVCLV